MAGIRQTPNSNVQTTTITYPSQATGSTPQLQIINSPGGGKGQIQFHSGNGSFSGDSNFVWNSKNRTMSILGNVRISENIIGKYYTNLTNFKITGGNSGQVLSTDGTGNLFWVPAVQVDYGNSNVANYLPTYTGNVSANYFIGNGSQLTNINISNIAGSYSNSNVANYLPTYTGNVSANYFIGNGSQLTNINISNIAGSYSNSNVANYLPTYTGNLNGGNLTITGTSYIYDISSTGSASLTTANVSANLTTNAIYTDNYFYANGSPYGGGGGGVSIVPNDVTYTNGSLYGNADPGFTVVITEDDDSAYSIPVDFPIEFLGNSYSTGNVFLVSNSYLTFGPDEYTEYHPVGPVTIPVPAIYIGSADLSNQKYYYGYADGTDVFVIGFEGSIETGGETGFPAIQWELQVNSATPDQIKIVVAGPANNGGALNFPAGVWGISNGAEWIDQFQPLPWYSNTNDNTYNAITIAPVTPVAANTIAFTGPGVTYSENGGTTYINIDPFDQAISVGYNDDNSEAIISSVYYGLTITTATDGEQLTLAPLGDVNISAGSASNNQPGDGYQVNIYGGNAHDDPNSPGSNYDGGTVNITGGNPVGNTGVPGAVRLSSNNNVWLFNGNGQVIFPTLTVDLHNGGNQSAQTLQFGDNTQQAIITGPTPTGNNNAQRLIIQGQRGAGTGEGGDVYFWAGDADTNGGDIKIYAGDADNVSTGYGGYVNIEGGSGFDSGGYVSMQGGQSSNGQGAYAQLVGGYGLSGGDANIVGGQGYAGPGGDVSITGGGSANGLAEYGNVNIGSGASTWSFRNNGTTIFPTGNITSDTSLQLTTTFGNYRTVEYQTAGVWDVYVEDVATGPNDAWSWIDVTFKDNLINKPQVFIENQKASDGIPLRWTFDENGNLTLPSGGVVSEGAAPTGLGNTIAITPSGGSDADQQLLVYPTGNIVEGNHLHLTTGNLYNTELFLGNDNLYVKLANTGNIVVNSNDNAGNTAQWTFGADGNLTVPGNILGGGNILIVPDSANSGGYLDIYLTTGPDVHIASNGDSNLILGRDDSSNVTVNTNGNVTVQTWNGASDTWTFDTAGTLTVPGDIVAQEGNDLAVQVFNPTAEGGVTYVVQNRQVDLDYDRTTQFEVAPANIILSTDFSGNRYQWFFDNTGNLTLPGNSFAVNYANGTQVTLGGGSYGNSNVATFLASFGSNTISTTGNVSVGNINFSSNSYTLNFATGAYISGNANSLSRDGSILLQPYTGAGSTFPGVIIGGAGRLIAPNGGVFQIFNASDVTFQVPIKAPAYSASSTTSGGIQVTGGGGIGVTGNIYVGGNSVTGNNAIVAGVTGTLLPNSTASFTANVSSYAQITYQNKSNGADATADFILTADNGNDSVNYSDFGIINSGYDNSTPTNSLGNIVYAADSYLYAQGNVSNTSQSGGNLAIGTTVAGKSVKIFAGGANANSIVATISNTGVAVNGNVTATNFSGNISITGNVIGTTPNVTLVAGSYSTVFANTGVATFPGNISTTGNFVGNGAALTNVAVSTTGTWTVATGINTYSITVPINGNYQLWVRGNIPNGIIAYQATVSVTNTNVPVLGTQRAWNYTGGGSPILLTTMPTQIVGAEGTISTTVVSTTTANRFDFIINNSSGSSQTIYWGYVTL